MEAKLKVLPKDYPIPKSNIQEVLYRLIFRGRASLKDFGIMQGLRTRFSELRLRYGLNLQVEEEKGLNRFGNPMTYHVHILPETELEKAKRIYLKMHGIKS